MQPMATLCGGMCFILPWFPWQHCVEECASYYPGSHVANVSEMGSQREERGSQVPCSSRWWQRTPQCQSTALVSAACPSSFLGGPGGRSTPGELQARWVGRGRRERRAGRMRESGAGGRGGREGGRGGRKSLI